ncbi:NAD-dependent epimerase/dehydratase family protein [Candidatus Bipolaricaulota bacterium]
MTGRVIITGANGFIGRHLVAELLLAGQDVCAVVRSGRAADSIPEGARIALVNDPHCVERWIDAFADCDFVIHLIGLSHSSARAEGDRIEAFREVNVHITSCVLKACLQTGVRRLIYLSSVKAIGEGIAEPYTEMSECSPENPYGRTKREAELLILDRTRDAPIEASILRSPIVYGPGVRGNVARILRLVRSRLPLPIRCLKARRSIVYVRNLTDAIRYMVESRTPVEGIYHVTDAENSLSARQLFRELASSMDRKVLEVPIPSSFLRLVGRMIGLSDEVDRLTRSLTIRGTRLQDELGWLAPYPMRNGLERTARWFLDHQGGG